MSVFPGVCWIKRLVYQSVALLQPQCCNCGVHYNYSYVYCLELQRTNQSCSDYSPGQAASFESKQHIVWAFFLKKKMKILNFADNYGQ